MEGNKLVTITDLKTSHLDSLKDAGINLKCETYSIIKHNKLLPENTIKNEIRQLLSKYRHENDIPEQEKQENK